MGWNPLDVIDKVNHQMGKDVGSVLEFLGITDPAVDPDGVRDVAKKWKALAHGLERTSHDAGVAMGQVKWQGETARAYSQRAKDVRKHAGKISDALHDGDKALRKFADEAEHLIDEIGTIAVEIMEFEAAGLALSVLTAGVSEAASTIIAGERALKIARLISKIEEAGSALSRALKGLLEIMRGLRRALRSLKEIKAIATVAKLAGDGVKYAAFDAALHDRDAFTDPGKLAELVAGGALGGLAFGLAGKAVGKALHRLKPSELNQLRSALSKNSEMGTRRRWRNDSSEVGPPQHPGDDWLPSDIPVYHGDRATAIGYDKATLNNLEKIRRLPGYHDLVLHGGRDGSFFGGQENRAGESIITHKVHSNHVLDALLRTPSYEGGPVRLVVCHSGAPQSEGISLGQNFANQAGVPVKAPSDLVGVPVIRGIHDPEIHNGGHWKTFLPLL